MKIIFLMITLLSVLTHAQTSEPEVPGDTREWVNADKKSKVWPALLEKIKPVDGNKITLKLTKLNEIYEKDGKRQDKEISVYYKKFYMGGILFSVDTDLDSLEPTRAWLEKQVKGKKVIIKYSESIVRIEGFAILE